MDEFEDIFTPFDPILELALDDSVPKRSTLDIDVPVNEDDPSRAGVYCVIA